MNSIGFSGTTIVAIWLSRIGPRLGMPVWFGGMVASVQVIATAAMNLLTPVVLSRVSPLRLASVCLPCAAAIYLVTQFPRPVAVFVGCVVAGGFLGIVLNSTNRIVAASEHVQRGYSIFQIVESLFSALFILSGTILAERVDIIHIYLCNAGMCMVGAVLLLNLPVSKISASAVPINSERIGSSALMGLTSLSLFFIAQNGVLSYSVPLGAAIGVRAPIVTSTVSAGLVMALLGATASEVLGERWGAKGPLIAAAWVLFIVFIGMTKVTSQTVFLSCILLMMIITMFVVPYFFTLLAQLDRSGRVASVGPAFLLTGVALGSALATLVSTEWGVRLVWPVAGVVLVVSALLVLAIPSRNRARAPRMVGR